MNFSFNGPGNLSEVVLQNYLSRAVTMQFMCEVREGVYYMMPSSERKATLDTWRNAGAKFMGRLGGWWDGGGTQYELNSIFTLFNRQACYLKNQGPDIICQAAVFEHVSSTSYSKIYVTCNKQ